MIHRARIGPDGFHSSRNIVRTEPYGTCRNCEKRPASGIWLGTGSVMDYIHGGGVPWCELCMVKEQLKHAEECAARVPELRARLEALERQ